MLGIKNTTIMHLLRLAYSMPANIIACNWNRWYTQVVESNCWLDKSIIVVIFHLLLQRIFHLYQIVARLFTHTLIRSVLFFCFFVAIFIKLTTAFNNILHNSNNWRTVHHIIIQRAMDALSWNAFYLACHILLDCYLAHQLVHSLIWSHCDCRL